MEWYYTSMHSTEQICEMLLSKFLSLWRVTWINNSTLAIKDLEWPTLMDFIVKNIQVFHSFYEFWEG